LNEPLATDKERANIPPRDDKAEAKAEAESVRIVWVPTA